MEYIIEKNIPLPSRWGHGLAGEYCGMYPFHKMEEGDSFLYECQSGNKRAQARLCGAANHYTKRWENDQKFRVRTVNEGYRVWRVK